MPTVTADFTNHAFWEALGHSLAYGLGVLLVLSVAAAILSFATGATAARHWPKKNDAQEGDHQAAHAPAEAHAH